ncbi:VCBS repeat-containing protein [Duganella sp. BJB1802]|uniref:NBR1-Ig-like domain-containing protein n=1 Tax=Duganella sp. BJB1802 TaxID=2744575 RepID=UPI0015934E9D|nr:NBR1-Ig-like domain-containing protein [Duganella sp. BJB1802]NVD69553.1 VCBS repeat-containing protein [Duganella sp. BJB1802]
MFNFGQLSRASQFLELCLSLLRQGRVLAGLIGSILLVAAHSNACAANDAAFSSQTVSTSMTVGEAYPITISMKNTGTSWTSTGGYSLTLQNPGGWSVASIPVTSTTALNATRPFSATITPPSTPGTYTFQWCMTQGGVSFGACSTALSIQVAARAPNATFTSQSMTSTLTTATRLISVSMKNTGNTTWKAGQIVMGTQNQTWGINRLKLSANVAPNALGLFSGTITAPPPGYYDMQWQVLEEGGAYFGDTTTKLTVAVAGGPPTVEVASPTDGQTFISNNRVIEIPFHVTGTPTGVATILRTEVLIKDSEGVLVPWVSAPGPVLDTLHRTGSASLTMYARTVDSFNKSSALVTIRVKGLDDDSTQVSNSVPATMVPGVQYNVAVVFRNAGETTWDPQTVSLVSANAAHTSAWGDFSVPLTSTVAPGGTAVFNMTLTAPPKEGAFSFAMRLQESTRSPFGTVAMRSVTVARIPPTVTMTAPVTSTLDIPADTTTKVLVQGSAVAGLNATISKLEVLDGAAVIATANGGAIDQMLELPMGTHSLRLRATDNWNETGLSAIATVTVKSNDAAYVSQSVPATMQVGKAYTTTVTMRNSGNKPWTAAGGYALGSRNPENNTLWRDGRVPLTTTVGASGQLSFSVPVTAPTVPGTYNFQWQMLQEGVEWFGPETPNVQVVVKPLAPTVPGLGQPLSTQKFVAVGAKADVRLQGSATAGEGSVISKLEVLDGVTVIATADGGSIDTVVQLAAGSHTLKLRATDNFAQVVTGTATTAITVLTNGASAVSRTAAASMVGGTTYQVTVVMRNAGTSTWTAEDGYALAPSPDNGTWVRENIPVTAAVAPGANATFTFDVQAPADPATYPFQWQMVRNGTELFGTKSTIQNIVVTGVAPTVNLNGPANGSTYTAISGYAQVAVAGAASPTGSAVISKFEVLDGTKVAYTGSGSLLNATVPLTPGSHVLQLRATDSRNAITLSQTSTVTVLHNDAAFVNQSVPATMYAGDHYTVTLTVKNTGDTTWQPFSTQSRLGMVLIEQPNGNTVWSKTGRVQLTNAVAPGATYTFSVDVVAPAATKQYQFQWRMSDESKEFFGTASTLTTVTVSAPPVPVVSLSASPVNQRVAPGQSAIVTLTGFGTVQSGVLSKLEVFADNGAGYGATALKTVNGSDARLDMNDGITLANGSYRLKLRATDGGGHFADSDPVTVNVTDSPLLGQLIGVRSNGAQLQLVGWVCRDSSTEALNYQVYVKAPSALGGVPVASGAANLTGEAGDAGVQQQCHTPGVSHHFAVDIAGLQAQYPGIPLYVTARSAQGETLVLPCEDHGCRIPEGLRIGLTSPNVNNLDRFRSPQPVFVRAVVTGYTGTLDEVAFNINGEWLAGTSEGAGAYSVSKAGLQSGAAPYAAYAKVRQGETTLITDSHMFFVDPGIVPGNVTPKDGTTVGFSQATVLSLVLDTPAQAGQTVKFFINPKEVQVAPKALRRQTKMAAPADAGGSVVGNAVFDGAKWAYAWKPAQEGGYTVVAKLLDGAGAVLMETASVTLTVSASADTDPAGGSGAVLTPVTVTPPNLDSGPAGTLVGTVDVHGGAATYSIALSLPPGTAGMTPTLSLNYDSGNTTGSAGLGWSVGGLSNIDLCGKTVATEGISDAVRFVGEVYTSPGVHSSKHVDRLCLDGQKLVLVNGDVASDDAYWAAGAEYRTELESFTRIIAVGELANRSFTVETRDGRVAYYGNTADSNLKGLGRSDSLAHRWRISSSADRSGNYISYAYVNDGATGESRPSTIRWGGNSAMPQAHYAQASFSYEDRPDKRTAYVAGGHTDERKRLLSITTSTDTDALGAGGIVANVYKLTYAASASSGRSLLASVQVCDGGNQCLPATRFGWGGIDPSAQKKFIDLGPVRTGPDLGALWALVPPSEGSNFRSPSVADAIITGDFNGDGKADILERYGAAGIPQKMYTSDADGNGWTASTPFSNIGNVAVMEVGDFDGDGKLDILIADLVPGTPVPANWRICWGRLRTAQQENCDAKVTFPDGAFNKLVAPVVARVVRDFNADGRDDIFLTAGDDLPESPGANKKYTCLSNGAGFDCTDVTLTVYEVQLGDPALGRANAGNADTDVDGDGRVDQITLPRCIRRRIPDAPTTLYEWFCGNSHGEGWGSISVSNQRAPNGTTGLSGELYVLPDQKTSVLSPANSGMLTGDLNADGYTDLVFGTNKMGINEHDVKGHDAIVCYSRGDGNGDCRALPVSELTASNGVNLDHLVLTLGDFDGDGMVDVLRPAVDTWGTDDFSTYQLCHIGANASYHKCEAWQGPVFHGLRGSYVMMGTPYQSAMRSMFMGDFNGDGKVDIVSYLGGSNWAIAGAADQAKAGEAIDKLIAVTNGVGNVETVEYAAVNDGQVYQQDALLPSGALAPVVGKRSYPNRQLVKALHKDIGQGHVLDTRYSYAGYAVDPQGRGGLGFAREDIVDVQSGMVRTRWPYQVYPHIGAMQYSQLHSAAGVLLSDSTETRQSATVGHDNQRSTVYSYVETSVITKKDLDGSALQTVTVTNGAPDSWGNILNSTSVTAGADPTQTLTVGRATAFSNNPASWLIGLQTSATETHTIGSNSIVRSVDYTYDGNGLMSTATREKDHQELKLLTTYDRSGNKFGLVNWLKEEWYDPVAAKTVTRTVQATGYSGNGRFVSTTANALGQQTQTEYDPRNGGQTKLTTANGEINSASYDGFGRKLQEIAPDGTETWTYLKQCDTGCPQGAATVAIRDVKRGKDRIAVPVFVFADTAGHALRQVTWGYDGTQIVTDTAYDSRGRVSANYWPRYVGSSGEVLADTGVVSAAAILSSSRTYDDLDRVLTVQTNDEANHPQMSTTTYQGLQTTYQNPKLQKKVDTRDVRGLLVSSVDALLGTTKFEYDAYNNLTKTTDPKKNVVKVGYDGLGRRTTLTDPDLGLIEYFVDPHGLVYKQISPNQRAAKTVTTMRYDALNRMVGRAEPSLISGWTYDHATDASQCASTMSCGKLVESFTMAGDTKDFRQTHSYDAKGRLAVTSTYVETGNPYTRSIAYDDWGRLLKESYQRGSDGVKSYAYRYNSYGTLSSIERGTLALWKLSSADASGRVTLAMLGNGLTQERHFFANTGRLSNGWLRKGTAPVVQEGYQYDVLGNVSHRDLYWSGAGFAEDFTYDDLNRLYTSKIGNATQTVNYDVIGNIRNKTGVGTGDYVYDGTGNAGVHAVSAIPGVGAFGYDLNGNLTSGAGRSATWTSFDMPDTISRGAGEDLDSSHFTYGADRQRGTQTRKHGSTSSLTYYGVGMEVELGNAGAVVRTYWPMGLGVEIDKLGTVELDWTQRDWLGSVIAITDQNGAAKESLAYDSWGKRMSLTGAAADTKLAGATDNKGYTGHEMLDQLELVHMNGRVYDPFIARFMSADPYIQDPGHSQSYNRYTYVWNNPTNMTDPTGFEANGSDPNTAQEPVCDKRCRQLKEDENKRNSNFCAHCWGVGSSDNKQSSKAVDKSNQPIVSAISEIAGVVKNLLWVKDYSRANDQHLLSSCEGGALGACEELTHRRELRGEVKFSMAGQLSNLAENSANAVPVEAIAARVFKEGVGYAFRPSENTYYHYTDKAGAEAIQEAGMILPNARRQVFLTREQLTPEQANSVLFLGRGGDKGTYVIEVRVRDGAVIVPGKNGNEYIHNGPIRNGRQADLEVKQNGF